MLEGRTLWELVEKRAVETPDAEAVVDEDGRHLSFADVKAEAEKAAAGLYAMGLREGDVVSWQLPTWFESQTLVLALARLGVIQNPILPIYRKREVGFVTRQAGTKLLVVPSTWKSFDFEAMAREIAGEVNAEGGSLEVLVADKELPQGDPSTLPPPPATPDDPEDLPVRWLFYTSGTTADPKGARHTDASVAAIGKGMGERYRVGPEDRGAMVFPFTHIGGITWLVTSLQFGSTNIFLEAFDPATTIPLLAQEGVTLAGAGTPFHLAYLNAQRANPDEPVFPQVRAFPGGGAPKPPQLHYDMKQELGGLGILSGYGLTEAPIIVLCDVDDPDDALANSEGRAMPGVDLRFVKLDESIAGTDEEGEIRVKAPQLMKGYLDASLDEEAFDADGYFRTGDLGTRDADGYVAITGRLKDIIIRKGENISAKEVEDLLYKHPKIADVAVIGLPDPASGERACAVVAPKDPADPLTLDEMSLFLREEGLMVQKIPEQLEIQDILPRNPTGKIVKHELQAKYKA
jgi:cyclohexanecarboxylate-CoA ligase